MRPRLASRFVAPLCAIAIVVAAPARADRAPLPTVPSVDLTRYAGTWHEVARLPNRFQAQCRRDVTAEYAPRTDGTLSVVNRCRTGDEGDGAWDVAEGVARAVDDTGARLEVTFLPAWLRWLPVGRGDYHVIALDPDYRWSMVGEPSRRYLWVLSRTPSLPADTLAALLAQARALGFAVDRAIVAAPPPATAPGAR